MLGLFECFSSLVFVCAGDSKDKPERADNSEDCNKLQHYSSECNRCLNSHKVVIVLFMAKLRHVQQSRADSIEMSDLLRMIITKNSGASGNEEVKTSSRTPCAG